MHIEFVYVENLPLNRKIYYTKENLLYFTS